MGLLRGRQYLGIVALFADFTLQGGGRSADKVLEFIGRQNREVPVLGQQHVYTSDTSLMSSIFLGSFLFLDAQSSDRREEHANH